MLKITQKYKHSCFSDNDIEWYFLCLKVSLLGWFSNRAGTSGRHKGLSSTSSAQFASQPLVKPVVWFVRTVIEWHSHSIAKSAYYLSDSPAIMCICHNFICCAIVSSFYNPVTKVDTENTTYHCFLLRKHLHTCSSAKNKFTDQIYFTNGSKVIFFFKTSLFLFIWYIQSFAKKVPS